MRWTRVRIEQFYGRAKRRAKCGKCGGRTATSTTPGKLVELGGEGGPARQYMGSLQKLKEAIRTRGWGCRECNRKTTTSTTCTPPLKRKRGVEVGEGIETDSQKVDRIRKEVKPFKGRHPDEMRWYREQRVKHIGVEGNQEWEKEHIVAGDWMDPDELEGKLAELKKAEEACNAKKMV